MKIHCEQCEIDMGEARRFCSPRCKVRFHRGNVDIGAKIATLQIEPLKQKKDKLINKDQCPHKRTWGNCVFQCKKN